MKNYSKEIKSAALILAGLTFLGCITAFVYSQVSDFWGNKKTETPGGLEFLEKHKDRFVKRKELIEVANVNTGVSSDLSSVYFSDDLRGVICGEKGTMLLTTDGGLVWVNVSGADPELNFTDCYISIDGKIFIIEESGNIHSSSDLGKTWEISNLNGYFIPLRIKFPQNGIGFIAGSNGTILKSLDKGKTWVKTNAPVKSIIYDLDFRDIKNGLAVGTDGKLLTTSDGGNNWDAENKFSEEYLKRIKYIGGANWIAAGAEGKIYISSSNGESWKKVNISGGEGFRSLITLDDEHLIAADSKGSIFLTKDMGETWEKIASAGGIRINQLVSINKNELIAAGIGGQVKRIIIK